MSKKHTISMEEMKMLRNDYTDHNGPLYYDWKDANGWVEVMSSTEEQCITEEQARDLLEVHLAKQTSPLPSHDVLARKDGKEAALAVSSGVNNMTYSREFIEEFVNTIMRDHRTLQQSTGNLVMKLLEAWSQARRESQFDARNDAVTEFAQWVTHNCPSQLRAFPFI